MADRSDETTLEQLLDFGQLLVSDLDLDRILSRVLEAAAAMTGARYAALGVLDSAHRGLERFVHIGVDEQTVERIGDLPRGRGVLGLLIREPRPVRMPEVSDHPESFGFPEGHPPMHSFLGVPIRIRGRQWGNLYLTEKPEGEFTEEDERIAVALADWAAVAIASARSVANDRLRFAMDAAEQERLQWARELHDETLQGLAGIRLALASGLRQGDQALASAVERSIEQIDSEISSMRALISDLRPDSLGETGLGPALAALAKRVEERPPHRARVDVDLPPPEAMAGSRRCSASIELAVYRVAQEAMTNALRHGLATHLELKLTREEDLVAIEISDNGQGFDPETADLGYGIIGMRERAELTGGELRIDSAPGHGATVSLIIPGLSR